MMEDVVLCEVSPVILAEESECHRMVWVGRDLKAHLVPMPLLQAGTPSTSPGCSERRPTWP